MKFPSICNVRPSVVLIPMANSNSNRTVPTPECKWPIALFDNAALLLHFLWCRRLFIRQGKQKLLLRPWVFAQLLFFSLSIPVMAQTIVVHPGQSIQAAINNATAGATIKVLPGVYHEGAPGDLNAVTITKHGIHLVGLPSRGRPVVLASTGQLYGIWVSPTDTIGAGQNDVEHPPCASSGATVEGFTISGFTLKNFDMHGLHLACVRGFSITNNIADGNQVYGLFPIVSENGVVSNNEVKNTPFDAALYVGQSRKVLISGNKVHDSLIGIDLENIRDCTIIQNRSFNNTVGIVIDSAPGLTRPSGKDNLVSGNLVTQNNRPGIAEGPPSGIGILVTATDDTLLFDNQIRGNQLSGIFVTSRVCPGDPNCGDPLFLPTSNNNRIISNKVLGNGTVPNDNPLLDALRADLSWDGTGSGNCWSFNQFTTSASPLTTTLPGCNLSP